MSWIATSRRSIRLAYAALQTSDMMDFWWDVIEREQQEIGWAVSEMLRLKRELKREYGLQD